MPARRRSFVRQPRAIQSRSLHGRPKNRLLAALPSDDFDRVSRRLTAIPISPSRGLYNAGELLTAVYFPNGGVMPMKITRRTVSSSRSVECGGN
jgi:hypothetical protein